MIGIVRIALTRPLTFIVMAILIAIIGVLTAIRTPVDIFPNIKVPVIAVAWQYSGLPPDQMSGRIVTPFERILTTTVNDIDHIESQAMPGIGVVKIYFQPGADIRTQPVDANLRAGGTLWMQGSPLTIWKRDPRPHPAWYYESYEPEQSSAQYYTQKFYYRRNDLGRASWPKKAFGGMELDAYRLPADFGLQFDLAQPSNMLPTKTDGNTNSHAGDAEADRVVGGITEEVERIGLQGA